MSIKQLADKAAKEILASTGAGSDKHEEVSQTVEKALLAVMRELRSGCVDAVNVCCSADQDLAHKISDELRQKEKSLIANLNSLR